MENDMLSKVLKTATISLSKSRASVIGMFVKMTQHEAAVWNSSQQREWTGNG
jgi:hypothetical protein